MSKKIYKILSLLLCLCLVFEQVGFAQSIGQLDISGYLTSLRNNIVQDKIRPLHLRYLAYDPLNNNFSLLVDKGNDLAIEKAKLEDSAKPLMDYFFVGLSLPNDAFWVNLRPDAETNIIDDELAKTDIGKIMLEADVQLKKDTARFTSPNTPEGKEYWDKLYKKAGEIFGYDNIEIPTLTRPWIVPDEILVSETKDGAYIFKATLKVLLEQDYLKDSAVYNFSDERLKALNEYSSQLIRELIIPKITQEVNSSKRYAALRQVYYSLILAQWFKAKFNGENVHYASLIDRHNLQGLTSKKAWSKTTYFKQYQKSFKEGEYNIQKPIYTFYGQTIRSYFSGGIKLATSAPVNNAFPMDIVPNSPNLSLLQCDGNTGRMKAGEDIPKGTPATEPTEDNKIVSSPVEKKILFGDTLTLINRDVNGIKMSDLIELKEIMIDSEEGSLSHPITMSLYLDGPHLAEDGRSVYQTVSKHLLIGFLQHFNHKNLFRSYRKGTKFNVLITNEEPMDPFNQSDGLSVQITGHGSLNIIRNKVQMMEIISREETYNDDILIPAGSLIITYYDEEKGVIREIFSPNGKLLVSDAEIVKNEVEAAISLLDKHPMFLKLVGERSRTAEEYYYKKDSILRPLFGMDSGRVTFYKGRFKNNNFYFYEQGTLIEIGPNAKVITREARQEEIALFKEKLNLLSTLNDLNIGLKNITWYHPTKERVRERLREIMEGEASLEQKRRQYLVEYGNPPEIVDKVLTMLKDKEKLLWEIGGGKGKAALDMARENPNWNIVTTDPFEGTGGSDSYAKEGRERKLSAQKESLDNFVVARLDLYFVMLVEAESFDKLLIVNPTESMLETLAVLGRDYGLMDKLRRGGQFITNHLVADGILSVMTKEAEFSYLNKRYWDLLGPRFRLKREEKGYRVLGVDIYEESGFKSEEGEWWTTPIIHTVTKEDINSGSGGGAVLVSSPLFPKVNDEVGGIDLRNLPIVTQAISNLSVGNMPLSRLNSINLDEEWQDIERLVNSGITPSAERIKEYLQVSCSRGKIVQDKKMVIACISDILRQQEEHCISTEPMLRDILIVLESNKYLDDFRLIFISTNP